MNQSFYDIAAPISAQNHILFDIDFKVLTTRFVAFDFVAVQCFGLRSFQYKVVSIQVDSIQI